MRSLVVGLQEVSKMDFFMTVMRSSTLSLSSFLNLQFYLLNFSNACTTSSRGLSHHSATIKKHFHLSELLVMFVFSISALLQRLRLVPVRSFFIHTESGIKPLVTCWLVKQKFIKGEWESDGKWRTRWSQPCWMPGSMRLSPFLKRRRQPLYEWLLASVNEAIRQKFLLKSVERPRCEAFLSLLQRPGTVCEDNIRELNECNGKTTKRICSILLFCGVRLMRKYAENWKAKQTNERMSTRNEKDSVFIGTKYYPFPMLSLSSFIFIYLDLLLRK